MADRLPQPNQIFGTFWAKKVPVDPFPQPVQPIETAGNASTICYPSIIDMKSLVTPTSLFKNTLVSQSATPSSAALSDVLPLSSVTCSFPQSLNISNRGKNGGATRKRFLPLTKYQLAEQAQKIMRTDPDIANLDSTEKKVQAVSKKVGLGTTKGVNPNNLRNWLNPSTFEKLKRICSVDPKSINTEGKHKGGRGNRKPGTFQKTVHEKKHGPWFPEQEAQVINMWKTQRDKRLRVTAGNVKSWMSTACADELQRLRTVPNADPVIIRRLESFKGKDGWLAGFLKRNNLVRRRATNKRSHGVEDLLGSVLGFTRFLRGLRRDNPSDEDTIWGVYGPYNTLNVDSVPVCFCSNCKTTIEEEGAERVSIIVPGSGLDKRQGTLHLCIRCRGEQPWPTLVLKGETTAEGKEDTDKRQKELEKYAKFKVHVLFQKNSWLTELLAVEHWIPCFKKDLIRLGLWLKKILLISDNLDAQKTEAYRAELLDMLCLCVYGPKNGTDVWQPVDHGVGQRYQALLAHYYNEWTKTDECIQLFKDLKAPSAPRVRELLVEWVHRAYEELEHERQEKDAQGAPSLFELAFLRTSAMVSANGDDIDDEMNPEGVEAAMKKSQDPYYQDHGIRTYRQLLVCSDKKCNHVDSFVRVTPTVTVQAKQADSRLLKARFSVLGESSDPRAKLITACLNPVFCGLGLLLSSF